MKTAIIYYSQHHGNTEKLVGGTSKGHPTEEEIRACVEFFEGLEG